MSGCGTLTHQYATHHADEEDKVLECHTVCNEPEGDDESGHDQEQYPDAMRRGAEDG